MGSLNNSVADDSSSEEENQTKKPSKILEAVPTNSNNQQRYTLKDIYEDDQFFEEMEEYLLKKQPVQKPFTCKDFGTFVLQNLISLIIFPFYLSWQIVMNPIVRCFLVIGTAQCFTLIHIGNKMMSVNEYVQAP